MGLAPPPAVAEEKTAPIGRLANVLEPLAEDPDQPSAPRRCLMEDGTIDLAVQVAFLQGLEHGLAYPLDDCPVIGQEQTAVRHPKGGGFGGTVPHPSVDRVRGAAECGLPACRDP